MTRALACLIHNSHHYFIDVTILVQQGWRCWKHASHLRRINRGAICREPTVLYWVAGPSTIRHCLYRPCRRRQPTHIALILPILEQVTLSRTSDRSNICWRSNCVCVCVRASLSECYAVQRIERVCIIQDTRCVYMQRCNWIMRCWFACKWDAAADN